MSMNRTFLSEHCAKEEEKSEEEGLAENSPSVTFHLSKVSSCLISVPQ